MGHPFRRRGKIYLTPREGGGGGGGSGLVGRGGLLRPCWIGTMTPPATSLSSHWPITRSFFQPGSRNAIRSFGHRWRCGKAEPGRRGHLRVERDRVADLDVSFAEV